MPSCLHFQETPIDLELEGDCHTVLNAANRSTVGHLKPPYVKILSVLRKELNLQLVATEPSATHTDTRNCKEGLAIKSRQPNNCPSLAVFVIIYGSPSKFELVGQFARICGLHLQHPRHCHLNVEYHNPHCLSPEDPQVIYTSDLTQVLENGRMSIVNPFHDPMDILADGGGDENLVETETPQTIQTQLHKHQKQALTFMKRRENGWMLEGHYTDVWKREIDSNTGRETFFNIVTGRKQTRPPPLFRGGLLTDAPGLGKSLAVISMVASAKEEGYALNCSSPSLNTTLLIVPKTCKLLVPSRVNVIF